jgi:hypothetical protein
MSQSTDVCLYCERDSSQVPLMPVVFKGQELWICPQHLPILIHKPAQLEDKLPGVAQLSPGEHHHHD